jgi:hypothetical protein
MRAKSFGSNWRDYVTLEGGLGVLTANVSDFDILLQLIATART